MLKTTKGGGAQPEAADQNEKCRTVASDLASVIGLVRKSLAPIETEMLGETAPEEAVGDIFVLDDVTPGHVRAHAVLREYDAGLNVALRLLQESMISGGSEFVVEESPPQPH